MVPFPLESTLFGGASAATQFMIIEIVGLVRACNSTSGSSCRRLAVEWKVAGSSPAMELFFLSPFLFFPLFFPPFLFYLPSFKFLFSLSPFISPLHARSATSMLKHFSSCGTKLVCVNNVVTFDPFVQIREVPKVAGPFEFVDTGNGERPRPPPVPSSTHSSSVTVAPTPPKSNVVVPKKRE